VRGEEHRDVRLLAQPQHVFPHQRARLRIEADRRLVEEQHSRDVHERPGDFQTACHPAGELRHEVVAAVAQVDELEHARDALVDLAAGHAVEHRVEAEVLLRREPVVEGLVLEDEADVAAHRLRSCRNVKAGDRDAPGRRPQERAQHVDRRRLAGAIRPQEREHLALTDIEADPVHSGELAKPSREVTDLDHVASRRKRYLGPGVGGECAGHVSMLAAAQSWFIGTGSGLGVRTFRHMEANNSG